jgi:hypothetical protein
MARFIALLILLLAIVFGVYYVIHNKNLQNPIAQYSQIIKLPTADQIAAIEKTFQGWVKDPSSAIPYPKGWRKVTITDQGYTFDVVTPDTNNPPQYYAAFKFPKPLIPSMHLIKCVGGLVATTTTDGCVVGDNPTLNAYFNIIDWLKTNPITNPKSS